MLRGVSYKPGWTFGYSVSSYSIMVTISFRARNSDVVLAPLYDEEIDVDTVAYIDMEDIVTSDDLYRRMFEIITDAEMHEAREFFAVGGIAYHKPVHPHVAEGNELWKEWSEYWTRVVNRVH